MKLKDRPDYALRELFIWIVFIAIALTAIKMGVMLSQ